MKRKILMLALVISLVVTTISGCNIQDYSYNNKTVKVGTAEQYGKTFSGNLKQFIKDDKMSEILNEDNISLIDKYGLPQLERMSKEDAEKYINNLQVISKMNNLKYDINKVLYPEKSWKELYQNILENADKITFTDSVEFNGNTASELNDVISKNSGKIINITSNKIELDTTIKILDNTYLQGNNVELICEKNIDKAIYVSKVKNVVIEGIRLSKGIDYGIYILESESIYVVNNEISNLNKKALAVMGNNNNINVIGNIIKNNAHGGIYFNGKISKAIIEDNTIYDNKGTSNWMAGIVLTNLPITNIEDPYDNFREDLHFPTEYRLDSMPDCPNEIIIRNNIVENNNASGIYSDGAYENYIIGNSIINNDKEGICLDYGTIGTYLSENTIAYNGRRINQSDKDLENDFVLQSGRMEDGSSKSKLPGISIDNSIYNVISNNHIKNNYGSGIKMVRTAARNIIMQNNIASNNQGENEDFHFFGIELGYAAADVEAENLDFTPDYENIINRNTITGTHYAGIFLAEECYINDIFDNIIMDCNVFSMESLSKKQNSSVNNLSNKESRGISISNSSPIIQLPNKVD